MRPRRCEPTTMHDAPSARAASMTQVAGSPCQIRTCGLTPSARTRCMMAVVSCSRAARAWSIRCRNRPPGSRSRPGSIAWTMTSGDVASSAIPIATRSAASDTAPKSVARTTGPSRATGSAISDDGRAAGTTEIAMHTIVGAHRGREDLPDGPAGGPVVTNGGRAVGLEDARSPGQPRELRDEFRHLTERTALAAVDEAARAIAGVGDLEDVLQLIVDRVRDLVGAATRRSASRRRMGGMERFITSGIDPGPSARDRSAARGTRPARADHPRGRAYPDPVDRGASGLVRLSAEPPADDSFLGVPISARGVSIGNLYLTEKAGRPSSPTADQRSSSCSPAMPGSRSTTRDSTSRLGRLAVVEERERIGRDLHDGIIQALYAVGLSLEDVLELMTENPTEAAARVDARDRVHRHRRSATSATSSRAAA